VLGALDVGFRGWLRLHGALATLVAAPLMTWACIGDESSPTAGSGSTVAYGAQQQFAVRSRVAELEDYGPDALREMEFRTTRELFRRQPDETSRESVRFGLDPTVNAWIVSMPDSVDAELVSLILSIREVGVDKGYWERPQIREWWPIPEVKALTPGGYDEALDLRLQTEGADECPLWTRTFRPLVCQDRRNLALTAGGRALRPLSESDRQP